jgi:carbamoyltransferase
MKLISTSFLCHDSGMTFLDNGSVVKTILAERVTRRKHDGYLPKEIIINEIKKTNSNYFFSSVFKNSVHQQFFSAVNSLIPSNIKVLSDSNDHHLCHAYCGFYTSSFEDALCVVMDGNGSFYETEDSEISEIESVYVFKDGKFKDTIFKRYCDTKLFEEISELINLDVIDEVLGRKTTQEMSVGHVYERSCNSIGMWFLDGGKLMGLSQYYDFKEKLPKEYDTQEWKDKVDIAYKTQKYTEKRILDFVKKYVDLTGIKNVVLSGGVFLNCSSNYNLIKELNDINIHVDPMCPDNGISIGKSLLCYYNETGKIPNRIKNSYLGISQDSYPIQNCGYNYKQNVSYSDITEIMMGGNIVALLQGQSEVGQRSLGNRSLLFDPRISDGKTIVNRIKRRENYRPFAASVLLEHVNQWFDMKTLNESPYMSFAVDAYQNTIDKVPSVIHVNNTCRIQTVTQDQNYHFYNLINDFYNKTKIPMLLNTSFNLAGQPLVEMFNDAIDVMNKSELKYLYLPEVKTLIFK